jgi:hypothetical protein
MCLILKKKHSLNFYQIRAFLFNFFEMSLQLQKGKKINIFEKKLTLNFLFFDFDEFCITFKVGFSHKNYFLPLCDLSNLISPISLKKI